VGSRRDPSLRSGLAPSSDARFSESKEHDKYKKVPFDFAQGKFWEVVGGFEGGEE
jgi:hypothetical protein